MPSCNSGFLTWEWLYGWSEAFIRGERRLAVLTFTSGASLVGIAPMYRDVAPHGPVRLREIGFLGLPEAGSDYLDVIAVRGKERLVAQSLSGALFGPLAKTWDTIQLRDVPCDSVFLGQFMLELRRLGKQYTVTEGAFCPQIRLPGSFNDYLGALSGHGRQAYRRKLRALNTVDDIEHVIYQDEGAVRSALVEFQQLYEKRWGRSAEELFGLLTAYLSRAGDAWAIEVSLLRVRGRAVAGLVHLRNGRTIYQYLMAVDRDFNPSLSVGNLICGMNIGAAIEAGFVTYDFLKGEEAYKFQFMNSACRSMSLTVHNRTLRSLVAWTADAASDLGKILIR